MGRLFLEFLDGEKIYTCKRCATHWVERKELISKNFHGKTGRAFLFNKAVNVDLGPEKDKIMMTGLHTVKSVICKPCRQVIGWTYVFAYEPREKYKEGKFIIEKEYMAKLKAPVVVEDAEIDADEDLVEADADSGEADFKNEAMDQTGMLTGRSTRFNTNSNESHMNLISERENGGGESTSILRFQF